MPCPSSGMDVLSFAGQELSVPGPVRVVGAVVIGLRVWHQTKDPSGGVTYAGDVPHGPIGIIGRPALGWISLGVCVLEDYLVILNKESRVSGVA